MTQPMFSVKLRLSLFLSHGELTQHCLQLFKQLSQVTVIYSFIHWSQTNSPIKIFVPIHSINVYSHFWTVHQIFADVTFSIQHGLNFQIKTTSFKWYIHATVHRLTCWDLSDQITVLWNLNMSWNDLFR